MLIGIEAIAFGIVLFIVGLSSRKDQEKGNFVLLMGIGFTAYGVAEWISSSSIIGGIVFVLVFFIFGWARVFGNGGTSII